MTRSTRWLRLCAGSLALACLALALMGGTASATLSLDKTTDTTLTLDSDAHWFNNPNRAQVMNGYQYWAYWDAEDRETELAYLKIARRRLSDGNVVTLRFDGTVGEARFLEYDRDGHNFASIGLSPNDGRIHISWSLHKTRDRRHRYLMTNAGCMELTQANFNLTNCRFAGANFEERERNWPQADEDPAHEEKLTYPLYINDNEGHLYMTFRYDASARGDQYLNRYNDNGTWTSLGRILHGSPDGGSPGTYTYDTDGEGPERPVESAERGVYIMGIVFDKHEYAHLAWVWREFATGHNHGINYVYSTDGMREWKTSSGAVIGRTDSEPIDVEDRSSTTVIEAPPGRYPSGFLKLDSDNNPHIWSVLSDNWVGDAATSNQRPAHIWRNTSGSWYQEYAGGSEIGTPHLVAGDLILDQANNLYATFGKESIGWIPFNTGSYVNRDLPPWNVTWQPGGYLDVQVYSLESPLRTDEYVGTEVSTRGVNQLRVRMRNDTAADEASLYWTTRFNPNEEDWTIGRGQTFSNEIVPNDERYREYTFTITDADWTGALHELEFHPVVGTERGSVSIDWMKLTDSTGRVVKTWNMDSGMKLYSAEASAANNWASWTIDSDLLPGVTLQTDEGAWPFSDSRYAYDKVLDFTTVEQHEPGIESLEVREFDILGDDILKDWNFDTDVVGWEAPNNVTGFRWRDDRGTKGLSGTIAGRDSQLVSARHLKVVIGNNRYVHIRMRNDSATRRAEIYFQTNSQQTWTGEKSKAININARDTRYTEYSIDMSTVARWSSRETLYQLRIDPSDESNERGEFVIDRVWISSTR